MADTDIRLNDIGTVLRFTIVEDDIPVDISSATSQVVRFKKPDDSVISRTTLFYTSGVDGIVQYTTVNGDMDITGIWKVMFHVTTPQGSWKSEIIEFLVEDVI